MNCQLILNETPNTIWNTDYQTSMALYPGMTTAAMTALFATNTFPGLSGSAALPGFILNHGFGLYPPQQVFRLIFYTNGELRVEGVQDTQLGAQTGTFVSAATNLGNSQWKTIWSLEAKFNVTGTYFIMQGDGNLVLCSDGEGVDPPEPKAVWWSGTNGNPGSYLTMQDDGNLVIYNASNNPIWATNTYAGTTGRPPAGRTS